MSIAVNAFGTVEQQCLGKVWHASRKEARAAARRAQRQYGGCLSVYRCRLCGHWHKATRIRIHRETPGVHAE